MDAAKKKSDEAASEAARAEMALTGLVMLQTGNPMAKTHAKAARAAANAAKTAYERAKAESAKADAATTVTAAMTARAAAEEALKTAQAQAKIAMDKAAEALKAAGMAVKVTYDNEGQATYKLGEVTIVPGAEQKKETVDGKTVTTGREDWSLNHKSSRAAVTYQAASGNTPERRGEPVVVKRDVVIGSRTDSADDTMRLTLFDKYVTSETNRMVGIYKTGSGATAVQIDATEDAPYGEWSTGSKKYVIKRAEGEFYAVDGSGTPDKENASGFTIRTATKPANTGVENGIYYYEINGVRSWLERISATTDNSGNTRITYKATHGLESVRFPAAKSYEYMNYGTWTKLKEQEGSDRQDPSDLGTAFVNKLPDGVVTPTGDMLNFGSATYAGHWTADVRAADPSGSGGVRGWTSGATITADFEKNTISATLDNLGTLEGAINGNGFSGAKADVSGANSALNLDNSGTFTGKFSGSFFGPKAEEAGGVFEFTSEGRKAGEVRGSFGGRRE